MTDLQVEIDGESGGTCDCCGNETRTVWGYIHAPEKPIAAYFVQWTRNKPEHSPNFDFIIGTWGDESVIDKKLSSWILNANPGGGSFQAIDSADRSISDSELVNEALTRDQVVNDSELMEITTRLIDTVWFGDPRIEEIKRWIEADA